MEQIIKILIYIHAFFGGIGLITGIGSIIVKKGSSLHKRLGKLFSYAMIISALISIIVSQMPNHKNLFLFLIGIFTLYLVLAGNRALTLKHKDKADIIDKSISGLMFIASVIMIIIGALQKIDTATLFLFFGGFGALMTIRDFSTFKNFKEDKNAWLKSHLGRMIGALIASLTAFIVAGIQVKTLAFWLLPTIVGTIYIIYWNRKLKVIPKKA